MSCDSCLDTFTNLSSQAAGQSGNNASYIDDNCPNLCCELERVSHHSDCVDTTDLLIRLIIDDIHIDKKNGQIRESFLDDVSSVGASTFRAASVSQVEVKRFVDLLVEGRTNSDGSPRELIGFVVIPVEAVRSHYFDCEVDAMTGAYFDPNAKPKPNPRPDTMKVKKRAHAAYGTGLEDRPSHADIFACNLSFRSKSAVNRHFKELGSQVRESFVPARTLEQLLVALGMANQGAAAPRTGSDER